MINEHESKTLDCLLKQRDIILNRILTIAVINQETAAVINIAREERNIIDAHIKELTGKQ
jgi:hypothetical protein